MPRMLTSFAVIMALGVGMPALAANEAPKPEAGTEAATQQQAEQAPAQLEDEVGMKEEKAEGTPMMEEGAEASGEPSAMPETADQGGTDATGAETSQQAETDAPAAEEDTQAAETGATEGDAGMAAEGEAATTDSESAAGMAEEEPAGTATDTTGSGGASEEVDWAQYVGSPLMSDTGEELGEISTVIAGPDGQTMVIIERGGILGLGRKQYAMMPQDLRVEGDQVVAPMTKDQIAEMPEYEEPEPTE